MDLVLQTRDDILLGTLKGDANLKESIGAFTRVCLYAGEKGLQKALIDCTAVSGELSTTERFELGETAAAYCCQAGAILRIAVLGRQPVINGFGALVASNRGIQTQVFGDQAEALSWLTGKPTAA